MRFKLLAGVLGVFTSTIAQGVTTRLDSEYFAFKYTQPFAFHISGHWVSPPSPFSLGVNGGKFVVDARAASSIPSPCNGHYSAELPPQIEPFTPPSSVLGGESIQNLMLWGKECHVKIWMTGESDPQFTFKDMLPPNNHKSASKGIIEFINKSNNKLTTIEFAVLVEEAL
ncbi:hypothetical protein AYI92_06735 [Shewanella xiamenensis]|uniref:hypothetical protein n=1 Tax=Shewanella xiamenensis TaxID=332186 RepID=UPI0011863E9A|nr:hypothetical protein [Shewanella xiamenensis]TVL21180.1 hypothetical protein AYI90_07115 [Shewanella xiamenensis]TVL21326.1 hypothetical protein AYI91_07750 [Shewanella xiamenensis]TVL27388.1 hypothetical protein AYI92_06735 [Shewanella xiamenensis]TVL34935.1 hypothetical protein AYI93_07350 [Shewanella xiamenensis]TVL35964.1 hypothetical protein AYI95_00375 [Shewanella xiamenensis]